MYEIILFSGGVYKYDELVETVEDLGGLILRKDNFHISRGESYLSEEIEVMLIIPKEDKPTIKSVSQDIKGTVDELNLEISERNSILTYLSIYNVLSQTSSWMTIKEIEDLIQCPCPAQICHGSENISCVLDELNESLNKLCSQKLIESKKNNNKTEFHLK
jgi:hypothetical protein